MDKPPDHNRHDDSHREAGGTHQDATPDSPIVDESGQPYPKAKNPYTVAKDGFTKAKNFVAVPEGMNVVLTAIIAFSTITQVIVSCNNNASTSEQVKNLIAAANRVGVAAESFKDSAAGINGGVSNAVSKLDAQVRATEESTKLTRHVIEGGEAAVINAYATPLNIPNMMSIVYGVDLIFPNSGKVNATRFVSHASLQREALPNFEPIGKAVLTDIKKDQVAPDSKRQGNAADQIAVSTFPTQTFDISDISRMKAMQETFEIRATYSYGNGFGETIKGKVCLIYLSMHNPDGSGSEGWISCEEGRSDIAATLRRQKAAQQGDREAYPVIPSASTITLPH